MLLFGGFALGKVGEGLAACGQPGTKGTTHAGKGQQHCWVWA